nr:immunoglobulin light chain junction region [Macaca mulatta]
YLQGYSSPSSF